MARDLSRFEAYLDSPVQSRGSHAGHAAPVQETMSISPPRDAHSEPEAEVVRRFLREVGLSEASTSGSWSDMLHYMRGRLGLCLLCLSWGIPSYCLLYTSDAADD